MIIRAFSPTFRTVFSFSPYSINSVVLCELMFVFSTTLVNQYPLIEPARGYRRDRDVSSPGQSRASEVENASIGVPLDSTVLNFPSLIYPRFFYYRASLEIPRYVVMLSGLKSKFE